jgi:hypothetical protein
MGILLAGCLTIRFNKRLRNIFLTSGLRALHFHKKTSTPHLRAPRARMLSCFQHGATFDSRANSTSAGNPQISPKLHRGQYEPHFVLHVAQGPHAQDMWREFVGLRAKTIPGLICDSSRFARARRCAICEGPRPPEALDPDFCRVGCGMPARTLPRKAPPFCERREVDPSGEGLGGGETIPHAWTPTDGSADFGRCLPKQQCAKCLCVSQVARSF